MKNTITYDSQNHHRKSTRLQGYDYAGGGLYFVTICASRNAGNIFADEYVKHMISKIWEHVVPVGAGLVSAQSSGLVSAQKEAGGHKARPYVVMPDHFHGLIKIKKGDKSLGDYICEFKSRVACEYIAGVKKGLLPKFNGKIWHRNYYNRAYCLM